jgi:hypothetical protein
LEYYNKSLSENENLTEEIQLDPKMKVNGDGEYYYSDVSEEDEEVR